MQLAPDFETFVNSPFAILESMAISHSSFDVYVTGMSHAGCKVPEGGRDITMLPRVSWVRLEGI